MKMHEKMEVKLHIFFIPGLDGGYFSGTRFGRFLRWESYLLLVGCRDGWMDGHLCQTEHCSEEKHMCVPVRNRTTSPWSSNL
jgi:hypothetical protein